MQRIFYSKYYNFLTSSGFTHSLMSDLKENYKYSPKEVTFPRLSNFVWREIIKYYFLPNQYIIYGIISYGIIILPNTEIQTKTITALKLNSVMS